MTTKSEGLARWNAVMSGKQPSLTKVHFSQRRNKGADCKFLQSSWVLEDVCPCIILMLGKWNGLNELGYYSCEMIALICPKPDEITDSPLFLLNTLYPVVI